MANKTVYKLTEAQFQKVVEKSLNRLNEDKKELKEMDANTIVGASVVSPLALGFIYFITKNITSRYKAVKSAHPEFTAVQAIVETLRNFGTEIEQAHR